MIVDACNAVGDGYACEAVAIAKRIIAYVRNTVGDGNACEIATIPKCVIAYACNAVGDGYACEAVTRGKRIIADACNRLSVDLRRYCYCALCRIVTIGYGDRAVTADLVSIDIILLARRLRFRAEKPLDARQLDALAADGDGSEYHYHA